MPRHHTIDLSGAWVPPGGADTTWTRHFGRPGGLGGERLWLVIDGPTAAAVILNGTSLPAAGAGPVYRVDITALVAPRNALALVLETHGAAETAVTAAHGRCSLPKACGRVRLEIDAGVSAGE